MSESAAMTDWQANALRLAAENQRLAIELDNARLLLATTASCLRDLARRPELQGTNARLEVERIVATLERCAATRAAETR